MFLAIIGGDLRFAHLTLLAAQRSIHVAALGMERSPLPVPQLSFDDLPRADAILMPNPWRNGIVQPFADTPLSLDDVFRKLRPGTAVLLPDAAGKPALLPAHLQFVDLSANADYLLRNAYLTAEGAIFSAMRDSDRALMTSTALIIGYGRIGRQLARLLGSMGTETLIVARREEIRTLARSEGFCAYSMEKLPHLLPRCHFIFSTPPSTVLPDALLALIPPDALLIDLASPPYGFDLNTAQALSLHASRESGLPGRYCPVSAGEILLEAVLNALFPNNKEVLTDGSV